MKKLLIGVGGVVLVLVAAVVILPFVVPAEAIKQQVVEQVRSATGREVSIKGRVDVSVWPSLGVEVGDVAFGNAAWAREPEMATLSELRVELRILPLLSGDVVIDRFVLVDPVVHLERDPQGRANWEFETAAAKTREETKETPAAETERGPARALEDLRLGDVRVVNGTVTYLDAGEDVRQEIKDINVTVSLPSLDEPAEVEGDFGWNGETVSLKVDVADPRALITDAASPASVRVSSRPISLTFNGRMTGGEPPKAEGAVTVDVPSVRGLAAWAGTPITLEGSGLGPLSVAGDLDLSGSRIAFGNARIALDAMKATGDLGIDTGGARPLVRAALDVDRLDLNPYLGDAARGKAGSEGQAGSATPKGQAQAWSDEPIDLSALNGVDAELAFSAGEILVQNLKIGRGALKVTLKNGVLVADLSGLELYGGTATGRIAVNAREPVAAIEKQFALRGLQAQPFLADAAGVEWLEGTGEADIAIAARGRSQRQMVQSLDGNGGIRFTNGAIRGVNLAAMARNVKSAFLDAEAGKPQKTDFAELGGTFRIDDGILKNEDLRLLNPLVRLEGRGTVDLPKRIVDYRVEPKVVASLEGQGGGEAAGILVPVIVSGPWDDLSYRPDLAGVATEMLKDPGKALDTVKGLEKGLGDLGKIPEAPSLPGGTGGTQGPLPPDAGKAIKKLFGN